MLTNSRFHRGIAIDDRLGGVCDPTRQPLPDRNIERREQAEVLSVNILRDQVPFFAQVHRNGVIWDQPLQPAVED